MILQNGRPADTTGRLEKEIRTYDFLDKLGVSYQRIDHAPAMTMEVCVDIDKALEAAICKNLFLCNRQETDFYLLLMPVTRNLRRKICQSNWVWQGFLLLTKNIWKSFLILHPVRSVFSD